MKLTNTEQYRRVSGAHHPLPSGRDHRRSPILTRSELRQLVLEQLG